MVIQQPPFNSPPPGWFPYNQPQPLNGAGVAAVWLGIGAMFLWWVPLLGLGLAVGAIVQGNDGRNKVKQGRATNLGAAVSGLVLGCLAFLPAAGMSLLVVVGFS